MDCRAQVSFEYLLLAMFIIIIAMAAGLLIDAVRAVSLSAHSQVLDYRNKTIVSLLE